MYITEGALKIALCFRIQHDYETALDRDWESFSRTGWDVSYLRRKLTVYDEAAAEYVLRLKDEWTALGEEIQVDGITLDRGFNRNVYAQLFSVGFAHIYELHADLREADYSPFAKAEIAARFMREQDYDLILCGAWGSIGKTGLFPGALAKTLGRPFIGSAIDLCVSAKQEVRVQYPAEGGYAEGICALPAVISVGNALHPYLRASTLRAKMATKGMKAETVEMEFSETERFDTPDPEVLSFERKRARTVECTYHDLEEMLALTFAAFHEAAHTEEDAQSQRVEHCEDPLELSAQILRYIEEESPDRILLTADPVVDQAVIRVCTELSIPCLLDLTQIRSEERTGVREVYLGNMYAEFRLPETLYIATLRPSAGDCVDAGQEEKIFRGAAAEQEGPMREKHLIRTESDTEDLSEAVRLVATGNGLARDRVGKLPKLAEHLHAMYGASRPGALDKGMPFSKILGMSGSITAPEHCLVLGVSGMPAFLAGIENAEHIYAVNTDEKASIFRVAEHGYVGDCNAFIDRLLEMRTGG